MDLERVIQIVENPETVLDLYFTEKSSHGYSSFQTEISPSKQGEKVLAHVKELVLQSIRDIYTEEYNIVDYNPTGVADGALEIIDCGYVGKYQEVIDSFENTETENIEDNVDDLTFYTLRFSLDGDVVQIMRRVSKFKRLTSRGIIASFHGNTINEIDSKMVGIDGSIDLIDYNDEILILNHTSLERIFDMSERFTTTAQDMLTCLSQNEKIANFNDFEEDCMNDKRIQRTLTKMSSEGIDWQHCLDLFDNVITIINTFDLEIKHTPDEKIVYEDKSQLMDFLRIIRDAYYQTMINHQTGYDDGIHLD